MQKGGSFPSENPAIYKLLLPILTATSNSSKVFWTFDKSFLNSHSSKCDNENYVPLSDTRISPTPCPVKIQSKALIFPSVFADRIDMIATHLECEST
ncbi:hypothetical protein ACTXT7_001409 [Hymenolepis weldensis]